MKGVLLKLLDLLAVPAAVVSAWILLALRRAGMKRLPLSTKAMLAVGVLPVRRHYYEPFIDASMLRKPLREPRALPGIDWNEHEQLELLSNFNYTSELEDLPTSKGDAGPGRFFFGNGLFESGDVEYLYNMIRVKKPRRIIEIGSGYSTLIAARARARNEVDDPGLRCSHVCIEPFEMPWLESLGIEVVRSRVETLDLKVFDALEENDLLFIDSSHMIRPQGDVLFEFLEIIPRLAPGVIVHVHDIFSPRDYLDEWVLRDMRLWNEQYLLEAFLIDNARWKVIGAVNFMRHRNFQELALKSRFLTPDREPGSFYIQKRVPGHRH